MKTQKMVVVFILSLMCIFGFTLEVFAASEEKSASPALVKNQKRVLQYESKRRREPFRALVGVPDENGLTLLPPQPGKKVLQRYDLKQFRLVGIILGEMGSYARVLAPDGKSYSIKVGTLIGKYEGKVIDISQKSVLVREIKRYDDGEKIIIKKPETALHLNPTDQSTDPEPVLFLFSKI